MPLRIPLLLLLIAPALSASAQSVEASYRVVLTGKQTATSPRGDRIVSVRLTTKDVIEQFREALDLPPGRGARLVVRRAIDDLQLAQAQEFLVLDGTYHPVGGVAEALEMPATFQAVASRSRRRPGWVDDSIDELATAAFRMGDPSPGRSRLVFSALVDRRLRLLKQKGVPLGYVYRRVLWTINGGLVDPEGQITPITGRLLLGPEKVVAE